MNGFWGTFIAVVGGLATLLASFQGIKIVTRGKRTTFTANIWKRLDELTLELEKERADRKKETASLRAENDRVRSALQQFRYRDGTWMEFWHQGNVDRARDGLPILQLPETLRKWPEEISAMF